MSLIERAMNKLGGDPAGPESATEPPEPPTTADESPPPAVEPSPPAAALAPATAAVPDAAAAEMPAPAPDLPARDAAAATGVEPRLPGSDRNRNFIAIDTDRLAAGGFLLPGTHVNRQSEEYQRIKRRLLANIAENVMPNDKPPNLIMITSSLPGEGKTYTSVNLSISIAMEVDHTVLVIDTDIVKSDLSKTFGVERRLGLYDVLAGDVPDLKSVFVRTSIQNLVIVPAGQNRHTSTERLASAAMQRLTAEISERYKDRVVIFDSPPILATTTATALAPQVGQLVLVVEASKTKQETVTAALQALDNVQVTGLVLNKSKQVGERGYYYYYGYYPSQA